MTPERIDRLVAVYRDGLLNNTLPFWLEHAQDLEFGGIMTCVDRKGKVYDTDKSVWHQGRFAWMTGHLYNQVEKRSEWLDAASHTLEFIKKSCFDQDGRMFFQVTQNGQPIRKRRYAFSESFAAIAFAENAKATGNDQHASLAKKLFEIYSNHIPYPPKFTGVRPMIGMAHPMIGIVTYQRLRDCIGLEGADEAIDRAIESIQTYFMKPDLRCCMECVAPDGAVIDHIDGRMLNPGHAIEGAWFIMKEGKLRNKPEYVKIGLDILDWMFERGWDNEFGGIFYFRDVYNQPVTEYWQDMKFWWNHNETIIATLLAYQLTGNEKYAEMHRKVHDWSYAHFPDKECGEWYGYLRRDGAVSTDLKGNLFKGCFHVPRMELECWKIAEAIKSGDVGQFAQK